MVKETWLKTPSWANIQPGIQIIFKNEQTRPYGPYDTAPYSIGYRL